MPNINYNAALPTLPLASQQALDISEWLNNLNTQTLSQLIKKLFANGEQGFFYDTNDLSTMFQDAAGTIPVTAVGQPVGLMLDKSRGLASSSELKQSALAKMTGTAPVATFNTVTGVGTVNRVDVSNQSFILFNGVVGSKWCKVSVTNNSAGAIQLRDATTAAVGVTLAFIQPNTTFSGYVYVNSGSMLGIASSSGECGFTVNSIKELAGNHAYQSTSASRPILRKNAVTGANYLEFDGSDDFLQTANIDFTATDKVSLFAGVRKLTVVAGMVCELSTNSYLSDGSFYLATPVTTSPLNTDGFNLRGTTPKTIMHTTTSPASVIYTASGDIGGKAIVFRTNGVARVAGLSDAGTGKLGNYPLFIGRRGGTYLSFNGHIYGLIGIGKLTSDNDTAAIEKELAKRVGVTLNV